MKQAGKMWLPDSDTYFSQFFANNEGFQLDRLDTALSFVDPKNFNTAIDGGAHVGSWSMVLAGCFKRVLSFEPAIDTFECLMKNTEKLSNVYRFNEALGDCSGPVKVMDDRTRQGNTGSRFVQKEVFKNTNSNATNMVAIDDLLLGSLDFLKLDVEGAELLALQGAKSTLLKYKPIVFVESKKGMAERFGGTAGDALNFLDDLGATEVARIKSDYVFMFK